MSGLVELHLTPAVAGVLETLGYTAADAAVRDQTPAAARGTNLALAWPPAACYATPALAGLVSALAQGSGTALLLAPEHALDEWAAVLLPLAQAASLPSLVSATPARATRRLRAGQLRLLLTTPAAALALLERSVLKADQLGHIVLLWPEQFEDAESLVPLMQDLPADAQRIVVLAEPREAHPVVERYARKALLTGPLSPTGMSVPPTPVLRAVPASWSGRATALTSLLDSEDPSSTVIWCADQTGVARVRAALPVADPTLTVTTGDATTAALIVAWDLPTPERLAQLRTMGEVVLLASPTAARYLGRLASRSSMVVLRGATDTARSRAASRRAQVTAELTRGELDGELLALAPLFERYDPAQVAAALYRMNGSAPLAPSATAPTAVPVPSAAAVSAVARLWIGIGKKDGVTPADIVGTLTKELGLDGGSVGKIEIREMFSLVEVPAGGAEELARRLTGRAIRRKKVIAKLDGGSDRPGGSRPAGRPTGGSRGPSSPSPRGRPAPRRP
ncbi:MAG: DbpA RNA binding domain-containing protein [Gemmatimonadales bacterium]